MPPIGFVLLQTTKTQINGLPPFPGVIPAKAGIQCIFNGLRRLDPGSSPGDCHSRESGNPVAGMTGQELTTHEKIMVAGRTNRI